ncbi:MAG: hypothetical protein GEU91_13530 [Rhizobiales bacterium]|nr:hypothetical protein [Hyphomicrobiales bacterium]
MVGSGAANDSAYIAGDGGYVIEVVCGSRHQDALEWLVRGRTEDPTDYACAALLVHEPENPFDPNAVSVTIQGVRVGFLPPEEAAGMVAAMEQWGFDRATCDAVIEGGWYHSADDKGDFGVRLDMNPDFAPTENVVVDLSPPQPGTALVRVELPKRGRDLKTILLGAAATFAMFALIGATWLVVEPSAMPVRNLLAALPSAPTEVSPERAEADVGRVGVQPNAEPTTAMTGTREKSDNAEAKAELRPPVSSPSTFGSGDRRSPVSVAKATREPLPVPAAQATAQRPPPANGVATREPIGETMPAVQTRALTVPKTIQPVADRKLPVATPSASIAREVRPTVDHNPAVVVVPTPVAEEVRPPVASVAAALVPPAASPQVTGGAAARAAIGQADAEQTDTRSDGRPNDSHLAHRSPAAAPPESGAAAATSVAEATRKPSPARPLAEAEKPRRKFGSRLRARAIAKARTKVRAVRPGAKTRNAARFMRKKSRVVEYQLDTKPAPTPPPPRILMPRETMASRMIEGLTKEWTTRALPGLIPRRHPPH